MDTYENISEEIVRKIGRLTPFQQRSVLWLMEHFPLALSICTTEPTYTLEEVPEVLRFAEERQDAALYALMLLQKYLLEHPETTIP